METLDTIGLTYRTDKSSPYHDYLHIYERYFQPYKNLEEPFIFLELGIGDINSANREGESLRMWEEYFPNAGIVGIDLFDKSFLNSDRIKTFICSQIDSSGLKRVLKTVGNPLLIIDDCSHIQQNTIQSFEILFPYLLPGGLYCIEDTTTAYWPAWGGNPHIYQQGSTIMDYMFLVCHYVNMEKQRNFPEPMEVTIPNFIKEVKSVHFHHGLIIVEKK
jgi:hypothetical protein